MSHVTVTLTWLDGTVELTSCESAITQDGVLSLYPPGYGYSYAQNVRKIPLSQLREWSEHR